MKNQMCLWLDNKINDTDFIEFVSELKLSEYEEMFLNLTKKEQSKFLFKLNLSKQNILNFIALRVALSVLKINRG